MKKYTLLLSMVLGFILSGSAQAALTLYNPVPGVLLDDRGTVAVADDLYWFQDLSYFTNKTYFEQLSAIDALNAPGSSYLGNAYSDWHLATLNEIKTLWANNKIDIGKLFLPSEANHYHGRFERQARATGDGRTQHYCAQFDYNASGSYVDYGLSGDWPDNQRMTYASAWAVATSIGGTDTDGDGILDDGDNNGIAGDHPCTGGNNQNCDDNCPNDPNHDQADANGNGIGDLCERPIAVIDLVIGSFDLYINETGTFSGTQSYDQDVNGCCITEYKWIFVTANGEDVRYGELVDFAWEKPGYFSVRLSVKDDEGLWSEEVSQDIVVYAGDVVPEEDYEKTNNSRTLVNGTCWKFKLEQPAGGQMPDSLRWGAGGSGEFWSVIDNDWKSSCVTNPPHEVWFKAGSANCEIKSEAVESVGGGFYTALAPCNKTAKVNVKNIPCKKQGVGGWEKDYLGFWRKNLEEISGDGIGDDDGECESNEYDRHGCYLNFLPTTIGKHGCKLTSYSMLSYYFANGHNPKELNDLFKDPMDSFNTPLNIFSYFGGKYTKKAESDTDNPPYTKWVHDSSAPDSNMDINNIDNSVLNRVEDAGANLIFQGASINGEIADSWAINQITNAYTFDGYGNLDKVVDSLAKNPPEPSILEVKYSHSDGKTHTHYVLAVGIYPIFPNLPLNEQYYGTMILDPSGPNYKSFPLSEDMNSKNKSLNRLSHYSVSNARLFKKGTPNSRTIAGFNTKCYAQMLITDPSGRRAGILQDGIFIDEIGSVNYEVEDSFGIPSSYQPELYNVFGSKSLSLQLDESKVYELTIIGTGPGPYFSDIIITNSTGPSSIQQLPVNEIDKGVKWKYTCDLNLITGDITTEMIPPNPSNMSSDIDLYLTDGDIDNQGIATSLKQKLASAEKSIDQNNTKLASGLLKAFINEVEAQRDKHITNSAANNLMFHAYYILNQIDEREETIKGDINRDGVIDKNDVNIINANLNKPASACPECDIDGNGTINVLDARKLVLMCTCAKCVCP